MKKFFSKIQQKYLRIPYFTMFLKYVDEIKDQRKTYDYSMRYLIISEILMFLSEGKSQRFTETAFENTKYK